jgi:hypothetical protein
MGKGRWPLLACMCAVLPIAAPAHAAVTIGPNPLPERSGVVGAGGAKIFTTSVAPGVTLASPIDGVVVRWRVRRGEGPGFLSADKITLRILRSTGLIDEFTAVGTSEAHDVPGSNGDPVDVYEYTTRLPIAAGDSIGLGTTDGEFPYRAAINASYLMRINPLADGQTATFEAGSFSDRYVLVNADVEPDCDRDGFGDETQDPQIAPVASCGFVAAPADTRAPNARIDKGPRKRIRTRKQRATVKIRFSSNDPAASFECKLDGNAYRPCRSPKRYRIRAPRHFRKHTFNVRAIDPAGNVDPTPATLRFKLKRRAA